MLIVDAHLDLAWNAIDFKRDLFASLEDIRAKEVGLPGPGMGRNTVCFPLMRRAGIGISVATILARLHRAGNPMFGYATPEAVFGVGMGQLAYYQALERLGKLRIIRTKRDLHQQVSDWNADPKNCPLGVILSLEGADPVVDPADLQTWFDAGVRAIGLTHYGKNRYGGGTACLDGLEPEGYKLLGEVTRLGMLLDMTHLSDLAFEQVTSAYGGPVIASHQNARKFVDDQRQFSDEQIRFVISRDGVLGAACDAWMLQPNWIRGVTKAEVTMERVVDNIDHVCQLSGSVNHAGIGSDLDGGFGTEQTPADMDSIFDLTRIPELLARRHYTADDINQIMFGNWIRVFSNILPS